MGFLWPGPVPSSRIPTPVVTPSCAGGARAFNQIRFRVPLCAPRCRNAAVFPRSLLMMDFVMLAIALVFFAISLGYVYACDNL